MSPQPVVSTTFNRLKREWNQDKAREALYTLIINASGRNVSDSRLKGYKNVWVGSTKFAYHPTKPLSKLLVKEMFNQSYVSYDVQMTRGERKRHRDRQAKLNYTKDMAKQYEVFKSTKRALQVFKELKPAEVAEGQSALSSMVGSIKFTSITASGFKGLNQILRQPVLDIISKHMKAHGQLKLQLDVDFKVKDMADEETIFPTRTRQYEVLTEQDLKVTLVRMITETSMDFETKELKKSGLKLQKIEEMTLHYTKYVPLKGGSHIELPACIANSKSCINIKNEDELCFKYAVLCLVHKVYEQVHPERVTKYKQLLNTTEVKFEGLSFPLQVFDIDKFEQLNDFKYSVNVFDLQEWEGGDALRPVRVRAIRLTKIQAEVHLNLLFLSDGEHMHYVPITSFDRLMVGQHSKHQHKCHFCQHCLHGFSKPNLLQKHTEQGCKALDGTYYEMPEKGVDDEMKFEHMYNKFKAPFAIYLDFEALPVPTIEGSTANGASSCLSASAEGHSLTTDSENSLQSKSSESSTIKLAEHQVISFCFKMVCSVPGFEFKPVIYRGEDAIAVLYQKLKKAKKMIDRLIRMNVPIHMTPEAWQDFRSAKTCIFCNKYQNAHGEQLKGKCKVRDHCHLTGAYRGAAHKMCNIHYHFINMKIPVFCHNMKGYDSHFIVKQAHEYEAKKIKVIATNSEKFLMFSFDNFVFKDSMSFMNGSLDSLIKLNKYDGGSKRENWQSKFPNLRRDLSSYIKSDQDMDKLTEKGVYPYSFMDHVSKFDLQQLPTQKDFYNDLSKSHISKEEYKRAQDVWRTFDLKSMGEYHDLYLLTDVLLLADVYENFRQMCLDYYELDPCHYFTLPHFAWDAMLKMTQVNLKLITDIDMFNMVEAGKRGGMCQVSQRYAEANNKYMKEYDPSKPSSYIQYEDANNLYGLAMCKPLPTGDYEWSSLTKEEIMSWSEEAEHGYFLEVDLKMPEHLHDKFNDYPLAPEKMNVKGDQLSPYSQQLFRKIYDLKEGKPVPDENTQKLVLTLSKKENYVVHIGILQFYLKQGMELLGIRRCLRFSQSRWLKPYIDFNTQKRKESKSDFEKDFFKLMNNAPYGKTMEDVKNHMDFELVVTEKRFVKVASHPSYRRAHIISDRLVGIQRQKDIKLNRPIAVGVAILDLSKLHMYGFYYDVMKPMYGENCRLLYTDTDSLVMHINTPDVYEDWRGMKEHFDFSNYPTNHPNYDKSNAKKLGLFKDEADGHVITKFVALKPKMYAMTIEEKHMVKEKVTSQLLEQGRQEGFEVRVKEKMTAKGCPKSSMKKQVEFKTYMETLQEETTTQVSFNCIRSRNHQIYTLGINKRGLSPFENKRYYLDNINSLAYGHKDISK